MPPVAALPAPSTPHSFTRVTIPGADPELDYLAVDASASIVKAFPNIDWKDSSALQANTRAAPLLVLAGLVCLPGHLDDLAAPAAQTILDLAEVTAIPTITFLERCADTCDSLGLFAVPLDTTIEFKNKLLPALARIPAPSPFRMAAGDLIEASVGCRSLGCRSSRETSPILSIGVVDSLY